MTPAERAGSFHAKPVWQRAAVVAAGPIANFMLAIVIFAIWFGLFGVRSTEAGSIEIIAETPAAHAGFAAGDLIVAIDGSAINSFEDCRISSSTHVGRPLVFTVRRGEQTLQLTATPELREQEGQRGSVPRHRHQARGRRGLDQALSAGPGSNPSALRQADGVHCYQHFRLLERRVQRAAEGRPGARRGEHRRHGGQGGRRQDSIWLINLIAFISVSIGLINLFPIPLLDGGHLLFYALEAVLRPAAQRAGPRRSDSASALRCRSPS